MENWVKHVLLLLFGAAMATSSPESVQNADTHPQARVADDMGAPITVSNRSKLARRTKGLTFGALISSRMDYSTLPPIRSEAANSKPNHSRHRETETLRSLRVVFSVCTGALLCGAAGILRGPQATTHRCAWNLPRVVVASLIAICLLLPALRRSRCCVGSAVVVAW
jgi:transcriptional regulator GlxA family with amidase domain